MILKTFFSHGIGDMIKLSHLPPLNCMNYLYENYGHKLNVYHYWPWAGYGHYMHYRNPALNEVFSYMHREPWVEFNSDVSQILEEEYLIKEGIMPQESNRSPFWYVLNDHEKEFLKEKLGSNQMRVGIQAAGGRWDAAITQRKIWPQDRYVSVINYLQSIGFKVFVFAHYDNDIGLIEQIDSVEFIRGYDLNITLEIAKNMSLIIGPDSFLKYMSFFYRIPSVILFSRFHKFSEDGIHTVDMTFEEQWQGFFAPASPNEDINIILNKDGISCSEVSAEEVIETIKRLGFE